MEMNLTIESMKSLRIDTPEAIIKHVKLECGVCIGWGMDRELIADIRRRE